MEEIHDLQPNKSSKQTGETYLKKLQFLWGGKKRKKSSRQLGGKKAEEPMNNYFLKIKMKCKTPPQHAKLQVQLPWPSK